jgi:hypothetical protein
MLTLRRFASPALALATLLAPAAVSAQAFPGVPLPSPPPPAPVFPGVPLPYAPLPVYAPLAPGELPPPGYGAYGPGATAPSDAPKRWYGWQVLIPTLASDALIIGAVAGSGSGGNASTVVGLAGLIGHGISGPIVHLVHGHPLRALASFGLEAALPGTVIGALLATPCTNDVCSSTVYLALIGLPVAFTAGTALDSSLIAWEDRPAKAFAGLSSFTVAPLVLPPLHTGSTPGPRPAGAALVGTF